MGSNSQKGSVRIKRNKIKQREKQHESSISKFIKQKFTYPLRRILQQTKKNAEERQVKLKIASFNVNGIDHEAAWSIQKIFEDREYDVM